MPCTSKKISKCHSQGKICNPLTSRCVSTKGARGRAAVLLPEQLTVPMLKELLKAAGVKGYSKLRKQELINMFRSL